MHRHSKELVLLSITLACAVLVVLAAANAGAQEHFCPWQFPKVVGCVLAARDGLAGGLIAAAGALFVGWMAWAVAQDQFALSRNSDLRVSIAQLATEGETFARFVQTAQLLRETVKQWDDDPTLRRDATRSHLGKISALALEVDTQLDAVDRAQIGTAGDNQHRVRLQETVKAAVEVVWTARQIRLTISEVQGTYMHTPAFQMRHDDLETRVPELINAAEAATKSRNRVIDQLREQMFQA